MMDGLKTCPFQYHRSVLLFLFYLLTVVHPFKVHSMTSTVMLGRNYNCEQNG